MPVFFLYQSNPFSIRIFKSVLWQNYSKLSPIRIQVIVISKTQCNSESWPRKAGVKLFHSQRICNEFKQNAHIASIFRVILIVDVMTYKLTVGINKYYTLQVQKYVICVTMLQYILLSTIWLFWWGHTILPILQFKRGKKVNFIILFLKLDTR